MLRGVHSIKVRACDWTGAHTDSASYQIEVTSGNARPTLELVSLTVIHADGAQTLVQPVPADEPVEILKGESFGIQYDVDAPDGASDVEKVAAYRNVTRWATKAEAIEVVDKDSFHSTT